MGGRRLEDIHNCIVEMAQNDEVHYVSSLTFAKPSAAEYMQVLFSNIDSGNAAFKIYYENEGDNSLGFTRKNLALKISRRDAFWKQIYDTYGYPDDADALIWGDPQRAYMKVQMQGSNYNAYIILEDKEAADMHLIEMDEQKDSLPHFHKFTFSEGD